jgi:anti-anti-sigma regulatory factor
MEGDSNLAVRRLSAQYELSRVLAEAEDLSAGPAILGAVAKRLDCTVAELWLLDPKAGALGRASFWAATDSDQQPFVEHGERFDKGEGLPGKVWQQGTPLWIEDVTSDPGFRRRDEAARIGVRSAIAFPIRFAGRTTGVIQFFCRDVCPSNSALLDAFADIGSQLGLFLERLRTADTVVRQAREIVALSTPVLEVADRVLVAPIIGSLEGGRAEQCMSRILTKTVALRAKVVLIDVTGVPEVDSFFARFLVDTVHATRLLGSRVVLTGIRPALASTLIRLGARLDDIPAFATLAEGVTEGLAARSG